MISNFASTSSLTSGMSDYLDQVNHGNANQTYQYFRDLSKERLPLSCPSGREEYHEFTNGFTLPLSTTVFPDQTFTFQHHQDVSIKDNSAARSCIDSLHPQHSRFDWNNVRQPLTVDTTQARVGDQSLIFRNSYSTHDFSSAASSLDRHSSNYRPPMKSATPRSYPRQGTKVLSCQPYAKLIYQALKNAPGHRMVLKEIYEWFELHTDKPQTSNRSGWKNSIRHNLSMNAAFQKIEARNDGDDGKKTYVWSLSVHALAINGVESTTRYRKLAGKKSGARKRASKTIVRVTPANQPCFQQDPSYNTLDRLDMVTVKQERSSQDFETEPYDSSVWWSAQAQHHMSPQGPSTVDYRWTDRVVPEHNTDNYQLAGRFHNLNFPSPPLEYKNNNHYGITQQYTSDAEFRQSESPTPSMTTSQSPFEYYEDTENNQRHLVHFQGFESLQNSPQRKVAHYPYPNMYQAEFPGSNDQGFH